MKALQEGLKEIGIIRYRTGGCRALGADEFLSSAIAAARKAGITRIAKISELVDVEYPVTQSTRPNLATHFLSGVNTGSQGKGSSLTQATISSLMEGLEAYSQERRNPELIRGTFDELSRSHVIVDPSNFVRSFNCAPARRNETLLWTAAFCPDLDFPVLVPAELIFHPTVVKDYETRTVFPRGSNGAAAGTTYLDATIHALYELIERRFLAQLEAGKKFTYQCIESPSSSALQRLLQRLKGNYQVMLQMIQIEELPAIPVFSAIIMSPMGPISGHGCCFDFDIAIERALSEAIQSLASRSSGSREDQAHSFHESKEIAAERWRWATGYSPLEFETGPERRRDLHEQKTDFVDYKVVSLDRARALSGAQEFTSLHEEYTLLRKWLNQAGYGTLFIRDLTVPAIGIPTVRVLIPNMTPLAAHHSSAHPTERNLSHYRYRSSFRGLGFGFLRVDR